MNAKDQICQASVLGTIAQKSGINAPALDKEMMKMFAGRKIGEAPKGEASSIDLMKAWTRSWTLSLLAE